MWQKRAPPARLAQTTAQHPVSCPALRQCCLRAGRALILLAHRQRLSPLLRAQGAHALPGRRARSRRTAAAPAPRPPESARDARRAAGRCREREARACPCFGLQGELQERHVLRLQLLAVIQAHVQPSPRPRSALLFALTQPSCRGAGWSSAPSLSCACKGSRQWSHWDVS